MSTSGGANLDAVFDVRAYGAVGDGVANDQAAIQAAIQAAFNAGGGRVSFPAGTYSLAGNFATIPGFAGDNGQYLLYVPYNPMSAKRVTIELHGEVGGGALSLPLSGSPPEGAVVLYNNSPQAPQPFSSPYPWIIGGGNAPSANNVTLVMKDITVRQKPAAAASNTVHGIQCNSFLDVLLAGVRVDVDASFDSGAPAAAPIPDPAAARASTGIQTTVTGLAAGFNRLDGVAVLGYSVGLDSAGQMEAGHLYFAYCDTAVKCSQGSHTKKIGYLNTNNCTHAIRDLDNSLALAVDAADLQGNNTAGLWCQTQDHLVGNGNGTGYVNALVNHYPGSFVISGDPGFIRVRPIDGLALPVTLNAAAPPSPLVSGTVYRNTTGAPLTVYQPAYASVAGTAGTIAAALGTTNAPPTVFTQQVAGTTTAAAPGVAALRVPPGHYFSFTAGGTTLAAANFQQES